MFEFYNLVVFSYFTWYQKLFKIKNESLRGTETFTLES